METRHHERRVLLPPQTMHLKGVIFEKKTLTYNRVFFYGDFEQHVISLSLQADAAKYFQEV